MVDKVNGLVPLEGSWVEGKLLFCYKAAADLTQADYEELAAEGTPVILSNDGVNTYAALGYAAEVPAGWTEGTFAVA